MNKVFKTPILFTIFNRPEEASRVFAEIRKQKPKYLYISADGPRNGGEKGLCQKTRDVVSNIDWDCEVKTKFEEKNLSCKIAMSGAIDWFFENVEQGIILEDDCLPHPDFFRFCEELLIRYKDDEKIMMISGDNFQDGIKRGDASYYFSKFAHIWGWASWRRAWQHYDINLTDDKGLDTWDYQWQNSIKKAGGLSIIPNVNLVSNIGFGKDATHTKKTNTSKLNIQTISIGEITHPEKIKQDKNADKYTDKKVFQKPSYTRKILRSVYFKIQNFWNNLRRSFKTIKIKNGQAIGITLKIPHPLKSFYRAMSVGNYEPYIINSMLEKTALDSKVIWDVGAHIGYHTLVFSKYSGIDGKILAFEPNPKNRELLNENLKLNPELGRRVKIEGIALSDKIGKTTMRVERNELKTSSSGGYIKDITPPLQENAYENFEEIEVNTSTIDDAVFNQRAPAPNIMKIDVEGAELNVLEGGKNVLEKYKPLLVIEIHSERLMLDVGGFLEKLGYKIEIIDKSAITSNIIAY